MKRKILVLAMAGMMAAAALTGCGSLKEDDVAVTVDDKEITAGVANFYARYVQAQYETYYSAYLGKDMWNSEASEGKTYEESVKDSVLKELETMILLEEHMDEYDVSLSDEEKEVINRSVKEFDEANALEDKELVSGSKETVKRTMTLMAIQRKMRDAIQADVDTEVSDEEAAQKSMQYVLFPYTSTDENGESVDLTDEEKAEAKNKAAAFAEGAKTVEDFGAYATEQSAEAKTATFDAKTTSPSKELVKAADALEEGGVTDVIETDDGCYVAKVTSLLDREATDSKKQSIISEREKKLYTDTCDKWLDKAKIKVHESVWKKVDFNDMSITFKQDTKEPYADDVQTDDMADSGSEKIK